MHVTQRREYFQHSLVKLHYRFHLAAFCFETELQKFQSLDRIDRMHRLFQRQMHIVHLEQQQRLIDDAQPLMA